MSPLQLLLDPPLAAWPTMVAISTNIEIKNGKIDVSPTGIARKVLISEGLLIPPSPPPLSVTQ